ncbi:MAG: hypothetical protein GDA54_05710 [Alphaproteobacteria bacterium GM7ARS4]|nr:hypothetical protein [Alphaproteobacteria bacterium GM7ARS4]
MIQKHTDTFFRALTLAPSDRDVRFNANWRLVSADTRPSKHQQLSNGRHVSLHTNGGAHEGALRGIAPRGGARQSPYVTIDKTRHTLYDMFREQLDTVRKAQPQSVRYSRRLQKRYARVATEIQNLKGAGKESTPINGQYLSRLAKDVIDVSARIEQEGEWLKRGEHSHHKAPRLSRQETLFDEYHYDKESKQLVAKQSSRLDSLFKSFVTHFRAGRLYYAKRASHHFARAMVEQYGATRAEAAFKKRGIALSHYMADLSVKDLSIPLLTERDALLIQSALGMPHEQARSVTWHAKELTEDYGVSGDRGYAVRQQLSAQERETLRDPARQGLFQSRFYHIVYDILNTRDASAIKAQLDKAALKALRNIAALSNEEVQDLQEHDERRRLAIYNGIQSIERGEEQPFFDNVRIAIEEDGWLFKNDPVFGQRGIDLHRQRTQKGAPDAQQGPQELPGGDDVAILRQFARHEWSLMTPNQATYVAEKLQGSWGRAWGMAAGMLDMDINMRGSEAETETTSPFFDEPHAKAVVLTSEQRADRMAFWEQKERRNNAYELEFYRLNEIAQKARAMHDEHSVDPEEAEQNNVMFRYYYEQGRNLYLTMQGQTSSSQERQVIHGQASLPQDRRVLLIRQASDISSIEPSEQGKMVTALTTS